MQSVSSLSFEVNTEFKPPASWRKPASTERAPASCRSPKTSAHLTNALRVHATRCRHNSQCWIEWYGLERSDASTSPL
jgi:hypothetical protein